MPCSRECSIEGDGRLRILRELALIATLASCAAQIPDVHEGERLDPPPEVRAPPPPGPPPPRVAVTMTFAPSLPTAMALSSKALLTSLDGKYLSLSDAAVEIALLSPCLERPTGSTGSTGSTGCVEGVLTAANATKGTVVILVSSGEQGTARWTCVGRPVAPFDAGRQIIEWSQEQAPTGPNQAWPRSVQQTASSCITNAGRQGGW